MQSQSSFNGDISALKSLTGKACQTFAKGEKLCIVVKLWQRTHDVTIQVIGRSSRVRFPTFYAFPIGGKLDGFIALILTVKHVY